MARRRRFSRRFSRSASRTKKINVSPKYMRGGIRM